MMIYTTGYTGLKIEALEKKVAELNALVLDIRLKPWSRNQTWAQANLIRTFGEKYVPMGKYFGNVNYKAAIEHAKLTDFEGGVKFIKPAIKKGQNLILLCMCRDLDDCHRKIIARQLSKLGMPVEELDYSEPVEEPTEEQLSLPCL